MEYDAYNEVSYRYYFLDYKLGDVTGDGYVDRVYLVGEKTCKEDLFSDNIMIVVHDGRTDQFIRITMEYAEGYNPKLFLGNFVNKSRLDILVKIDTGGSGGYILSYLYSLMDGKITLLLDSESFEKISTYEVKFLDNFNIEVFNEQDDSSFVLSVMSNKSKYIKDKIYNKEGSLIKEVKGSTLALGAMYPIVEDYHGLYKLLAYQRIIGVDVDDDIGAIETFLKWNGEHMEIERVNAVVMGSERLECL